MSSFHPDSFAFGFLNGSGAGGGGGAPSMSNTASTGGGGGGGGGGGTGTTNNSSHGSTSSSILGSAGSSIPPSSHHHQQLASSLLQQSASQHHHSSHPTQQQQQQPLQYPQSLLQQLQLQLAGGGNVVSSLMANPMGASANASGAAAGGGGGGGRAGNHHMQHQHQQQQQQLSSYAAAVMEHLLAQTAGSGGGGAAASSLLSATGTEAQHQQQQHLLSSLHGFGTSSGLGYGGSGSAPTAMGTTSATAAHEDATASLVHSSSDGMGPVHRSSSPDGRGTTSSPLTTSSGKKGKASVLLDYTRDNPPHPNLLFVPKGTRQASVWSHMRLISTPESVAKTKRSGRDAVGLWCTACQRVVHHGWTSGETNPVKRHCTEKRHLAILSSLKKAGDPGSATGDLAASANRKGSRLADSGGAGGHRKGEGAASDRPSEHRRSHDAPPLVPSSSSGAVARGPPVRAGAGRERATELLPPPGKRFKSPPVGGASRPSTDRASAPSANSLAMAETKHRNAVQAYSTALVRSLLYSKVQMIRYIATDVSNRSRTKTAPLRVTNTSSLADPVALPASTSGKSDATIMESAVLTPDWSTMRIPPYSPDTALVVGNLSYPQRPADLCTRTLLQNVVEKSNSAGLSILASVVLNVGVKLSIPTGATSSSSCAEAAGQGESGCGIVDSVLSPVDCLITLLLGQIQLQEIGVDSISEVDDSLQLELSLHENPVTLVDNVVIVRENMLHLARQNGLQLDFQSDHDVHFHLNLVDSETGQNLFLRNSGSSQPRRSSSFVSQHDISGQGQSFLEGVLNHLPALMALTRPTEGSRPASASWDMEGSSSQAPLRVTFQGLDYRPCSWSANLYLALSGIVTAGMDGMAQNAALRSPASRNDDDGTDDDESDTRAAKAEPEIMPRSFQESLQSLKDDALLSASLPKPLLDRYMSIYDRSASNEDVRASADMPQDSTPSS